MSTAIRIFQGEFGRVALLNMDSPLVTHAHSQCHVLIKVGGPDSSFLVKEKPCPLTDETAVLVNPWEPHSYTHRNIAAQCTTILALYIEPVWLGSIETNLAASGKPGFFSQACVKLPKEIRREANRIAMQMLHGDQPCARDLETALSNLMMSVIYTFSEWRSAQSFIHHAPLLDRRVRRTVCYMRSHIGTQLNIDALAAEACLSRAHFFKLFQQYTGVTPHVYLNVLRTEAAIEELTKSNYSLSKISGVLGFSAQSHFTRFFHQHIGVVPSRYRRVVDVYRNSDVWRPYQPVPL